MTHNDPVRNLSHAQRSLAIALGTKPNIIAQMEQGNREVRNALLEELAKRMVRLSVTKYPSPVLQEPWLPLQEVQKVIQEMKQ